MPTDLRGLRTKTSPVPMPSHALVRDGTALSVGQSVVEDVGRHCARMPLRADVSL